MELPTLDFGKFLHGSAQERYALAKALIEAFTNHGFVKLTNHGLPEATVKQYLHSTKQLFNLPVEEKERISNVAGPHPQRGWSSKGAELTSKLRAENQVQGASRDELRDEREFFDAGPTDDALYPNKWPQDALPSFRPVMEECYGLLERTSLQIIAAMEVGLDLPEGTLTHQCIPSASEIRLNHYPSVDLEVLNEGKVKRTWPHTDFGIITLLFQDQIGGLELEDRTAPGTFVPVAPGPAEGPTELVVNISDTFERWTNGVIQAGVHRVDVPRTLKDQTRGRCPDRYSSIFFMKATRDTNVGPLPPFVTADRPARFDEITALEFQQRKTAILY